MDNITLTARKIKPRKKTSWHSHLLMEIMQLFVSDRTVEYTIHMYIVDL